MVVLWWLAPPVIATCLAMMWAGWRGREREEVRRDDSPEAMDRMRRALEKPVPSRGKAVVSAPLEPTHGVAMRRQPRRPASDAALTR